MARAAKAKGKARPKRRLGPPLQITYQPDTGPRDPYVDRPADPAGASATKSAGPKPKRKQVRPKRPGKTGQTYRTSSKDMSVRVYTTEERIEFAHKIEERMAAGTAIVVACRAPDLPGYTAVSRWMDETPEFKVIIARAKAAWVDALDAVALDILEDDRNWEDVDTLIRQVDPVTNRTVLRRTSTNRTERSRQRLFLINQMQARMGGGRREDREDKRVALLEQSNEALQAAAAAAAQNGGAPPKIEVVVLNGPDALGKEEIPPPEPDPEQETS
jgi:hypothetical protein